MKYKIMKWINYIKRFIKLNKSLSKKILVGLTILIIILIILSLLKKIEYGNSASNIYNLGLAVQRDKWIYYTETDGKEIIGINKVRTNGNKTTEVMEGKVYYLNIIGNYIYCVEEEENQKNIIKVNINGKNKKTLVKDIDEKPVFASDRWIYYYKNNKLYRIELNGKNNEKISDKEISYYQIYEKWIYYIYKNGESQYIAKMKLNGEETQRIAKAEDSKEYCSLIIKNRKIFFIESQVNDAYDEEFYLYKMNTNGEKKDKICKLDNNVNEINMQEDEIYYVVRNDYMDYSIKSLKYNGTEKTTIKEAGVVLNINVLEDWIIFKTVDEESKIITQIVSKNGKDIKDL